MGPAETSKRLVLGARAAAVPLGLVLGLAAIAFGFSRTARIEPADFAFVNGAEITSLDPATVTGIYEGRVLRFLFEGLCVKDPRTLEPVPGVAESWELSADETVYTFRLRADARWSNGDLVTAEEFVASWQRLLDPRTAAEYAYQLWYVRGARRYTTEVDADGAPVHGFDTVAIRAPSSRVLEVELETPTPYFLDLVASCPLFPTHAASLAAMRARFPDTWPTEWTRPEHLVTNGPYRIAERRINDRIRFVKSDSYWDAANVAFETVDALAVEHLGTAFNLYFSGAVGWIDGAPASLVGRLIEREDFEPAPYLGSYFYRVNVTRPPFDDVRVRRALALAIPRRAIVAKITQAGERPAWSHVPPGIRGYEPVEMRHAGGATARAGTETLGASEDARGRESESLRVDASADRAARGAHAQSAVEGEHDADIAFAADIAEARALFAAAGFGPGGRPPPTVEIHYNTQAPHADIAEVIADVWRRELGIDVQLANQEWKVFLATQSARGYDVSRSSWIGDYPDAFGFLDVFAGDGENNRTGWSDPRYDALLERARRATGEERRRALADAEALLMEELPILPIYSYTTSNLVDPRLGGFFENALDEHFPKFWHWLDDEDLAAKRAERTVAQEEVESHGPRAGLYPPAHPKHRARRDA